MCAWSSASQWGSCSKRIVEGLLKMFACYIQALSLAQSLPIPCCPCCRLEVASESKDIFQDQVLYVESRCGVVPASVALAACHPLC